MDWKITPVVSQLTPRDEGNTSWAVVYALDVRIPISVLAGGEHYLIDPTLHKAQFYYTPSHQHKCPDDQEELSMPK